MITYNFQKLDSTFAVAAASFSKYFQVPCYIAKHDGKYDPAKVQVTVIEVKVIDPATLRFIEKVRQGRERIVFIYAPKSENSDIETVLENYVNVFYIEAHQVGDQLIQAFFDLHQKLASHEKFYLWAQKAEEAFLKDDAVGSLAISKKLLKSNYEPFLVYMLMARAYFASGATKEALGCSEKALKIKPQSLAAASLVAACHRKMGRSDLAMKVLEECSDGAENSMRFMMMLGHVKLDNGEVKQAKKIFQKAKKLDEEDKEADEGLLAVSLVEGDLKVAKSLQSNSLASMDMVRFLNLRAISFTNNRKFDMAEKLYLNAIEFLGDRPENYKIFFNLGICLKKAGDPAKALDYMQECEKRAPDTFMKVQDHIRVLKKMAGISHAVRQVVTSGQ